MKICFNFLVCEQNHESRTKPIYNTFYKHAVSKNHSVYFVGGFNAIDDIPVLKLALQDCYESGIQKTLNTFIYHYDNQTDFDFFMLCDDDTFINLKNLEHFINTLSPTEETVYGSKYYPQDIHDIYTREFLIGGCGILMNRHTFSIIAKHIKEHYLRHTKHGDISIFLNIYDYNNNNPSPIKIKDDSMFTTMANVYVPLSDLNISNIITCHMRHTYGHYKYYEAYDEYNRLYS